MSTSRLTESMSSTAAPLWGVVCERKGGANTLAALKTIHQARPDGAPIDLICDNLSANKTPAIRAWAAADKVEICLTPTSASWANPMYLVDEEFIGRGEAGGRGRRTR
ncbi:hypothetical protein ACFV1N_45595 [Streptosporangium canum]|uniref:hypothetical protein n=1 Tax=Streptosporangium canum TaxID=324952 RepID=UPI0036A0DC6B